MRPILMCWLFMQLPLQIAAIHTPTARDRRRALFTQQKRENIQAGRRIELRTVNSFAPRASIYGTTRCYIGKKSQRGNVVRMAYLMNLWKYLMKITKKSPQQHLDTISRSLRNRAQSCLWRHKIRGILRNLTYVFYDVTRNFELDFRAIGWLYLGAALDFP